MTSTLGAVEGWGSLSVTELAGLLEQATRTLQAAIEELSVDEAAYHRKFWSVWQGLSPTMSIAAMNRECERQAAEINGQVILKRALVDAKRVRRDSLAAVLRSKA